MRTLRRRFLLRTDDAAMQDAMRYLECDPEIAGAAPTDTIVRIDLAQRIYRIFEDDVLRSEQFGTRGAVEFLLGLIFDASTADAPGTALLHAACLRRNGRRLLLVGAKGNGKTTLTLRLQSVGYQIEGDENVFVHGARVVARPRGLHVKESSLRLLPELAGLVPRLGYLTDYLGQRIYNLDPRLLGGEWRIEEGRADLIIMLRGNHGGYSSIRAMPTLTLAREIMQEVGLPPQSRGAAIGAIVALCSGAKGYDLSLGDHGRAIDCINRACDAAV